MKKRFFYFFIFSWAIFLFLSCNSFVPLSKINIIKDSRITIKLQRFKKAKGGIDLPNYLKYGLKSGVIIKGRYLFLRISLLETYLFDLKTGTVKKICDYGEEPGKIFYYEFAINRYNDDVIISDFFKKVNVFDYNGELKKSFQLPVLKSLGGNITLCKNFFIEDSGGTLNFRTETGTKPIFKFDKNRWSFISNNYFLDYLNHYFYEITPYDTVLVTSPETYKIKEYNMNGDLIYTYDEMPKNYVNPFDLGIKNEHLNYKQKKEKYLNWINSWSVTRYPIMKNKKYFIIPEIFNNNVILNFYSYKTKKIIKSFEIKDRFIIDADDKYLFLGKFDNNGEYIIDKYLITYKNKKKKIKELNFIIKDQLNNNYPTLEDNMKYIYENDLKKIKDKKSNLDFKFLDFENNFYYLKDKMENKTPYHFIIFVRNINDGHCQFLNLYKSAVSFSKYNKNLIDTNIVITLPYKDELKNSFIYYKIYKDANIYNNTDISKMIAFYSKNKKPNYPYAKIILVNNKLNILNEFQYDETMNYYQGLEKFYEDCKNIIKSNKK